MKKLLSLIAVTVTAATAVAAGAYIVKKLEQEKDEEVKLIEIINEDESEKKTKLEESEPEEESTFEELVEEQIATKIAPEVEPEEVVEEITEEPVVEDVVEEVEEVIEEPVVEDVVEEVEEVIEEPVVEDVVEEVEEVEDPYNLLSERKKVAICNQIQVMIDSMNEFENVDLQHYIVFPSLEGTEAFLEQLEDLGYDIFVEENGQEVNLIKNSKLEYYGLETEILSLAQLAAEFEGAYKGWAVKVDE